MTLTSTMVCVWQVTIQCLVKGLLKEDVTRAKVSLWTASLVFRSIAGWPTHERCLWRTQCCLHCEMTPAESEGAPASMIDLMAAKSGAGGPQTVKFDVYFSFAVAG